MTRMSPLPSVHRFREQASRTLFITRTLVRSGMLAPLHPRKYLQMSQVMKRVGVTPTTGLSLAAARRPEGLAIVDELGSLTWGELESRSAALAHGLSELAGGRPPETLAILARNHRGFVEALHAAGKLGADALLLNTGFSAPQLTDVLVREGATMVIYDEEFAELLGAAREAVPGLVEVVAWTDAPQSDPAAYDAGRTTVEQLITRYLGEVPGPPTRSGRTILLTSGTTGTPKGAKRSGEGGAGALSAMLDRVPWQAEEVTVVAAPMFHAWGFGQLAFCGTMTCTAVMRRRFDAVATLELVEEHAATGLSVVPVMLERIMDLPAETLDRFRLSTLRFVSASGSRMRPDAVTAFMDRFGDVVYNSYNATEAGQITIATPADLRVAPDTAGTAVDGTVLRVVDDAGRDVPVGEVGRIVVQSESVFAGYTSGDTKASEAGFMVSGDLGRLDEEGRLYVVGRDDEMIVSGGENVYPLEVERALAEHPGVREAAVVGVDDERFGQRLAAYVVLAPVGPGEQPATPDELKAHVKSQLAGYKVPRDVTLLDELPRNASGKIMKRELSPAPSGSGA